MRIENPLLRHGIAKVAHTVARKLARAARRLDREARIEVAGVVLRVDPEDAGGAAYLGRGSYELVSDYLLANIARCLRPELVVDVGANYGFTAIALSRTFADASVVAVEASPHLIPYLRDNLAHNRVPRFEVVSAMCDRAPGEDGTFSLNPHSSQDNRVVAGHRSWKEERVSRTSLDTLLADWPTDRAVFVKIDTQGFEERVFAGGQAALGRLRSWIVKAELAPHWLRSQGSDPVTFLAELATRYHVCEWPARPRFAVDTLAEVLAHSIAPSRAGELVRFVERLNRAGDEPTGWCDLLVAPKDLPARVGAADPDPHPTTDRDEEPTP